MTSVPVRSLTVSVSTPAECSEIDFFEAIEVHGHVADIAEQASTVTVGGEVDVLVGVGAVELQGIRTALSLDDVATVAGVPDERVVAVT